MGTTVSSLKHGRQTFHSEVGIPGDHSVNLALPMPTVTDSGSTHLDLSVTVERLSYCLANMTTNAAGKEAANPE